MRRGRPPQGAAPQVGVRDRLVVPPEALVPAEETHGWTVLAPTVPPEACTDAAILQAYQEQHSTVAPGLRGSKPPAAITPLGLEQPARIAALAMLPGVGFLVYGVLQRQVRLCLREHDRPIPGNTGLTAVPTAAVGFALFTPVMLVHCAVDNAPILHIHGSQEDHRSVCEAVGRDHAGNQGAPAGHNSLLLTTPP
jgi:hypothetical protein